MEGDVELLANATKAGPTGAQHLALAANFTYEDGAGSDPERRKNDKNLHLSVFTAGGSISCQRIPCKVLMRGRSSTFRIDGQPPGRGWLAVLGYSSLFVLR
jgi:hypothetical protein